MFRARDLVLLERIIHPLAESDKAVASALAGRPAPTLLWQTSIATVHRARRVHTSRAPTGVSALTPLCR